MTRTNGGMSNFENIFLVTANIDILDELLIGRILRTCE